MVLDKLIAIETRWFLVFYLFLRICPTSDPFSTALPPPPPAPTCSLAVKCGRTPHRRIIDLSLSPTLLSSTVYCSTNHNTRQKHPKAHCQAWPKWRLPLQRNKSSSPRPNSPTYTRPSPSRPQSARTGAAPQISGRCTQRPTSCRGRTGARGYVLLMGRRLW